MQHWQFTMIVEKHAVHPEDAVELPVGRLAVVISRSLRHWCFAGPHCSQQSIDGLTKTWPVNCILS